MKTGLLIITHEGVGRILLDTATALLGMCSLQSTVIELGLDEDSEACATRAGQCLDKLDQGGGVLVLTDMYGASPCNVAVSLAAHYPAMTIVAGINLPMLIRVLNYPDLDLEQMAVKAISGGQHGVLRCNDPDGSKLGRGND